MSKDAEYLVNLDTNIIKNVIASSNVEMAYLSQRVLNKPENYLHELLIQGKMPKKEYMTLCDFFKVSYSTFSVDGKYVFSNIEKLNVVKQSLKSNIDSKAGVKTSDTEKTKKRIKSTNVILIDGAELSAKLKATNINRAEFAAQHNKSKMYINYCCSTGKMDKDFYDALLEAISTNQKTETKASYENKTSSEVEIKQSEDIHIKPIFNEVTPKKVDLVKVVVNNKKYVLIEEAKLNMLVNSLRLSTDVLNYIKINES